LTQGVACFYTGAARFASYQVVAIATPRLVSSRLVGYARISTDEQTHPPAELDAADRLYVPREPSANHVTSILARLGPKSRMQVTLLANGLR
jgi:hypothetical protein